MTLTEIKNSLQASMTELKEVEKNLKKKIKEIEELEKLWFTQVKTDNNKEQILKEHFRLGKITEEEYKRGCKILSGRRVGRLLRRESKSQ